MSETIKQRIRDRLAGIRFSTESEAELAESGIAFAHARGKLKMLDTVEAALEDFLGAEEVPDETEE